MGKVIYLTITQLHVIYDISLASRFMHAPIVFIWT